MHSFLTGHGFTHWGDCALNMFRDIHTNLESYLQGCNVQGSECESCMYISTWHEHLHAFCTVHNNKWVDHLGCLTIQIHLNILSTYLQKYVSILLLLHLRHHSVQRIQCIIFCVCSENINRNKQLCKCNESRCLNMPDWLGILLTVTLVVNKLHSKVWHDQVSWVSVGE